MRHPRPVLRMAVAGLLGLSLVATACGNDEPDTADSGSDDTVTTMAPDSGGDDMMTTTTMADDSDMGSGAMGEPTGPACSAVPADGPGSFTGMAQDPAATAASNNPVLSTLVEAVTAAGLGDTLNSAGPFTIFAPTNDAFAKIPADTLNSVLADKEQLTKILTYHVVPGKMSLSDLASAGSEATVEGGEVSFSGDASALKVNDASVVCGDVQVGNGTVHIIDTVLMPM